MLLLEKLIFCFVLGIVCSKGDSVCEHDPLEFGIVLDSSISVDKPGFRQSQEFLNDFLGQFHVGNGRKDIRVSLISFASGIYEDDGFDLDTYGTKEQVLDAITRLKWRQGSTTDTGDGIEHMRSQLDSRITRPNVQRVALVLTDGDTHQLRKMKEQAKAARRDGIKMYALGVGKVKDEQLEMIAGSRSRVIKVEGYDVLQGELKGLTSMIVCREITTTPAPKIQECGEKDPADINFVFSPADLGLDSVSWTSSFVAYLMRKKEMAIGFQFGFITGPCPSDVPLDRFQNPDEIQRYVPVYDEYRLPSLAKRVQNHGFSRENGARAGVKQVVVFFVNENAVRKGGLLEARSIALNETGVEVYIANPQGNPVKIRGAKSLEGAGSAENALEFLHNLCPSDHFLRRK